MQAPLRIQALTLTTSDAAALARFYRWVLDLRAAPEAGAPGEAVRALSWGKEDRVRIVDAGERPDAEDAIALRMPAMSAEAAAAWCQDAGVEPVAVAVAPVDREVAASRWPSVDRIPIEDPAGRNRLEVRVRAEPGLLLELVFPHPREDLVRRGELGPFYWRSADWRGLEIPGLLGVTSGSPEPEVLTGLLRGFGVTPLEGDGGPLGVGDHQWILERRERAGVVGFAAVAAARRIGDLRRTLEHLGADHRHDGNRLLAADPSGRFVLVTGVHAG